VIVSLFGFSSFHHSFWPGITGQRRPTTTPVPPPPSSTPPPYILFFVFVFSLFPLFFKRPPPNQGMMEVLFFFLVPVLFSLTALFTHLSRLFSLPPSPLATMTPGRGLPCSVFFLSTIFFLSTLAFFFFPFQTPPFFLRDGRTGAPPIWFFFFAFFLSEIGPPPKGSLFLSGFRFQRSGVLEWLRSPFFLLIDFFL